MILPDSIKTAMNILNHRGFECFAVGGCVRDYIMGRIPTDYDLATSALPDEMISCFEGFRIIETGIKHGTVTVVIDGENVEITTYRIDGEYKDNRHPEEVSFTSDLSEDLSRRDFTVNAMAYSVKTGIVDLFGGTADAERKIIRCVGDADRRFCEDGLRILRAMRFASVLDFSIESETSESILRCKSLLGNISRERIFSELTKLICGCGAERVLEKFSCVAEMCLGCEIEYSGISKTPPAAAQRYAALLRKCKAPKNVMQNLRADNKLTASIAKVCPKLGENFGDLTSVRYLIRDIGSENAEVLCGAMRAFANEKSCAEFQQNLDFAKKMCCNISELEISGDDVKALGITGRDVGKALNCALEAVIGGETENEKNKLLNFIKTMLDN